LFTNLINRLQKRETSCILRGHFGKVGLPYGQYFQRVLVDGI